MKSISIVTPRVRRAQRELVMALKESTENAELDAAQTEGKLSAVICEVWNEVERIVRAKPLRMRDFL